jgi:hypothetical protein
VTELFTKFEDVIALRQGLLDGGHTDPFGLVMEKVESPTVAICNGKRTILLGTYNYMGMTFDPDVVAAGKKALDEFGSGTTGSRVLNGTYVGHKAVEQALKDFYAMDHAMVFSTGYQANLGIISTIAGKGDYIVLDIDSHASIYDGCKMGDAEIVPFRHNDVVALEKRLARIPAEAGKLVVLEGVYSMLGDVAPLKEMVAVSKAAGAMILVDEAHSMGFIGANGRGVAEAQGVLDDVDFIIGTFSKSVGTVGQRGIFRGPQRCPGAPDAPKPPSIDGHGRADPLLQSLANASSDSGRAIWRRPGVVLTRQDQAVRTMNSNSVWRARQPSTASARRGSATSAGGSPGRRGNSCKGTRRPATAPTVAITSVTE